MRNAFIVGFVLAVTAVNVWMNWRLWQYRQVAEVREAPAQLRQVERQHGRHVIGQREIFRPSRIVEQARPPWSNIESDDYLEYAKNLRGLGCPEETVRNILLADIAHNFNEREREIWNEELDPFWVTDDARQDLYARRAKQAHELTLSKLKLLRELFQYPVDEGVLEAARNMGMTGSITRLVFGFLDREQFVRLYGTAEYYTKQAGIINESTHGILLPGDYDRARELREQLRRSVGGAIGQNGFEELRLRHGVLESGQPIPGEKSGFPVSGVELREIWKLRTEHVDLINELFVDTGFEDLTEDVAALSGDAVEVKVAKYLGVDRYADYARAHNEDFRDVYKFVSEKGLRQEDAIAVFEERSKVADEVAKIEAAEDLSPEESLLLRAALKARAESVINQRLGKIIGEEYRQNDGKGWLDEIVDGIAAKRARLEVQAR